MVDNILKVALWAALTLLAVSLAPQDLSAAASASSNPRAPEPVFPEPGMDSPLFELRPVFTWRPPQGEAATGIVAYRLEISREPGFKSPAVAYTPSLDRDLIDLAISDSLAFGTHYWWRVAGICRDGTIEYSPSAEFWTWLPGDIDHSHVVNIGDVVFIVNYMFGGGDPPDPSFVMDVNGDCIAPDIADLIYLISYMFTNGAAPKAGCLNRSGLL